MPTDDYAGSNATTGQIFFGSSVTGSIETAYDQDWFAFTLNAGNTYIFTVEGLPSSQGALSGPTLKVINSLNGIVGFSGNSATGNSTTVTYDAPNFPGLPQFASGTYFISVQAYYGWLSTGTYRLSMASSASTLITGTSGSDALLGSAGNDNLDGGADIDTVTYSGNRASFTLAQSGANFIVTGEGVDTVTNVERLVFADTKIALDVVGGNAGTAAKILGVTVGAANATNPTYMGIILGYLDGGTSYADLMGAVLNAIGATTPRAAVTTLLTNILDGAAPPADLVATCVSLIESGAYSVGSFGALAADYNADNTAHINLVGLAQTGIEFV